MRPDQRILVTGGAGFIGSHLVGDLIDAGAAVLAVDNGFAGSESLLPDGVRFENVDIRDDRLAEPISEFDPEAIVHLAALHHIPYCNANPEETFEVNVMGTRNLLSAARELSNLETFLFSSSAAVYAPGEGPHRETEVPGPTDIYGETKLVGEDLVGLFDAETDVSTISARLFNVYGPNETNEHLIPAILRQVRRGDRRIELGNLTPRRDFIHVSDVTSALAALLESPEGAYGTYNVGTGTEYSVRDVVERTSVALGEEIEFVQAESRTRESDRPHLKADISRMRADFDWEPEVYFVDGLMDLLDADEVLVE